MVNYILLPFLFSHTFLLRCYLKSSLREKIMFDLEFCFLIKKYFLKDVEEK